MSNEWFENGEFPPAGTECLIKYSGEWYKTHIIGMSQSGACVYECDEWNESAIYDGNRNPKCFKPMISEREETIERMLNATQIANLPVIETIFGALYDAGYRKQLPYPQFVSIIQLMFINDLGFSDESALDMARSLAVKLNHSPDKDNQDV